MLAGGRELRDEEVIGSGSCDVSPTEVESASHRSNDDYVPKRVDRNINAHLIEVG